MYLRGQDDGELDGLITTLRTGNGWVVPDLTTATGAVPPAAGHFRPSPLATAIEGALTLLAEAAHRRLTRLSPTFAARTTPVADALTSTDLTRCADAVCRWAATPSDPATWLHVELRLLTANGTALPSRDDSG